MFLSHILSPYEQLAISFVKEKHRKEWHCHIQFVLHLADRYASVYDANRDIVRLSAILHDIGRDQELPEEHHEQAGVRIASEWMAAQNTTTIDKELVLRCIANHGADVSPRTIEEKIVITADAASKIEFHEAFMLLCKKTTHEERAMWGMNYLQKGYAKIQFNEVRSEIDPLYARIKMIYEDVLS